MDTLLQNISAILEHPASLIALIAVLFAILSHLYSGACGSRRR